MSESTENGKFVPLALTDEFMIELFSRVQHNKGFRPWKNEVDQFFKSRIWMIIEEEATLQMGKLFSAMLKPGMSEEEHGEIRAAIRMMSWWLNLEGNIFSARMRTMEVDALSPGGETWTP